MKQNYYFIFFCLLQHFILNVSCLKTYFFVKVLPINFEWNIEVECSECTQIRKQENEWKIENINFDKLYVCDFFNNTFKHGKDIPQHSDINRPSFGYSEDDPRIKELIRKLREHNAELQRKAANEGSSSSSYGTNTDDDSDNNSKFENLSITPKKVPKPKRIGNENSTVGNVSPISQGSSNDNQIPPVHPPFGHGFEYGYSNSHHNSVDGENHLPYHERTMAGSVNEYGNFGGMPNYGWPHPYPYNSSSFPPNSVPIQPQPHEITHFPETNTGSAGPPVSWETLDYQNESEYSTDGQSCTIC